MIALSYHYGHYLRVLHWQFDQAVSAALAQMDLTASQGQIIGFLSFRKEPPCSRDIEEALQMTKDISEYEYTSTIKSITNSLKAFGDDIGYSADYYLGQIVTGKIVTIDELIEKIEAVTIDDVVKIAEKIKLQMIYFLTAESEAKAE